MLTVRQTRRYEQWYAGLRDVRTRARVDARIRRLSLGHFGDAKSVGDGIGELRIDTGPGYRVYFVRKADDIILLLSAGDKGTQTRDIEVAKALARQAE